MSWEVLRYASISMVGAILTGLQVLAYLGSCVVASLWLCLIRCHAIATVYSTLPPPSVAFPFISCYITTVFYQGTGALVKIMKVMSK